MTAPQGPSEAFLDFVRSRELAMRPAGPANTDIAKYILAQTTVRRGRGRPNPGEVESDEPSLVGRLFDILSRSNYAVAEFAREWAETGDPDLSALGEGFSGRKKTTYSDFLEEVGMEEGFGREALGLGLDIFADPLTYVGGAGIAAKISKGKEAKRIAARGEKPLAERLLAKGEPVSPESFGIAARAPQELPTVLRDALVPQRPVAKLPPPVGVDLPMPKTASVAFKPGQQLQAPGLAVPAISTTGKSIEDIPANLRTVGEEAALKSPVGQKISDVGQYALLFGKGFGAKKLKKESAEKAQNIVDGIKQGSIAAIAKVAPKPLPTPKMAPQAMQEAADDILAKFDPNKATAALNKQFPDTLNAKQQRFLWEKAREQVQGKTFRKGRTKASIDAEILANTAAVYKRMEDALITSGKVPRIGTGDNVKLSDVVTELMIRDTPIDNKIMSEFASEIKKGSPLYAAVQGARAKSALGEADDVKALVDTGLQSKTSIEASGQLSTNQLKGFEGFLKNYSKDFAKSQGVSPAGVKATGSLLEVAFKSGKSAAQVAIEGKKSILDYTIATGKNRPEVNAAMVIGLNKDLGKLPPLLQGNKVADMKVVDWIMGRVATWWGQRDLRPMTLNMMGSGYSISKARGQVLDHMFKGYSDADKSAAFKIAQGLGKPETDNVANLARELQRFMDNTVGHSMGQSTVFRSGIHIDMLNKWMARHLDDKKFKFKKGTVQHPLTKEKIDLSKGTDWVKSWQYWDIGDIDPKKFMFYLQESLSQATVERALFDDVATRFGSRFKGGEFNHKIDAPDFPYLDGYYFPKDIATQIPRAVKDWTVQPWGPSSDFGKFLDRAQSMWKSAVTIYRPGHHIRNMGGDMYLGWTDGVNTLKPYRLAARVQRSMGSYEDIADVDKLIEFGLMPKNFGTPAPGEVIFKNKSGVGFTADQIRYVADQKGLLEHTSTLEDIIDMGDKGVKGARRLLDKKPLGGKVQHVARRASELQSHNARLAHFIDKVMKSRGNNLDEIFEHASRRARKFHPTGLDLTFEEKKYLRRMMPFYSWMRKSTPLLMEGLLMKPGKAVIPSKIYGSTQAALGIETGGREDPFPVDQLFPSWIKDQGLGPISGPEGWLSGVSNQSIPGYVMGGVGFNPLAELGAELGHPVKTLGGSLSLAGKIPIEALTGREIFTGEPITGPEARPGAFQEYVGEQIPGVSSLQRMTGITPFGTETKQEVRGTGSGTEEFFNWLSGLGVKGTGRYIPSARYEARQEGLQQRRLGREEFFKRMREMQSGS